MRDGPEPRARLRSHSTVRSRIESRRAARTRAARLLAALVGLACTAACGRQAEEGAGGDWQRLTLTAVQDVSATLDVVQRFEPALEPDAWTLTYDREPLKAGEAGSGKKAQGSLSRVRRGMLDPGSFNRIRVSATILGTGVLQANVLRDGASIGVSRAAYVRSGVEHTYDLRLAEWHSSAETCDEVKLSVRGRPLAFDVQWVELLAEPLESYTGTPDDEPASLMLFAESPANWQSIADRRPSQVVTARRSFETEFEVREGAVLAFSFAEPEPFRSEASPVHLAVSLAGAGGAQRVQRFVVPRTAEQTQWSSARIELDEFSGEHVSARFAIEAEGEAACAISEVGLARVSESVRPRPSVLLITSDTHRADHLGASRGAVDVRTPTLDALAARGVNFERCFTYANVTNPSHVALMTGAHPRDTRILDNNTPLKGTASTLAERFAAAGYRTFGAISVRHLDHPSSGLGQGFDRLVAPFGRDEDCQVAIATLERWLAELEPEQPVFVWLHVFDAHFPYAPPEGFDVAYDPEAEQLVSLSRDPSGQRHSPESVRKARALYKGEVSYLDGQLARLFDIPRFNSGISAFVSDHGESFGEHGHYFSHGGLYPASLHVPLVIAWPGGPAGRRVARLVAQADLGRTLLNLAGLYGAAFPGGDLRRHLEQSSEEPPPHFALHANGIGASMTHRGHHLLLGLGRSGPSATNHRVELYDLATDPTCLKNLVDEEFELARQMRAELLAWITSNADLGWLGEGLADSRMQEQLVALGYSGESSESDTWLWTEDDCVWCQRFE